MQAGIFQLLAGPRWRVFRLVEVLALTRDDLWWRDEDADYICHRSDRYPGATDLEVDWTLEAAADLRCIVHDPDPKSRSGAVRIIGYSPQRRLRHHHYRNRYRPCTRHRVEEQRR